MLLLRISFKSVRDIHEVYRMFEEMISGTHMVHTGSPGREEAQASSRYVLYLESGIVVLNINCLF